MTADSVQIQPNIYNEGNRAVNLRPNEKIQTQIRESTPVHLGRTTQTIEHPHVTVTITADPVHNEEEEGGFKLPDDDVDIQDNYND